jgi:hypothetical protein
LAAVGQSEAGFVCAHLGEKDGWIPAAQVQITEPERIPAPISAWRGTWHGISQPAAITIVTKNGELRAWFQTNYPDADSPDHQTDCMDGIALPKGSAVTFTDLSFHDECTIRLMLVGDLMVATATDACTSFNMRYGAFYVRDSKTRPVTGGC